MSTETIHTTSVVSEDAVPKEDAVPERYRLGEGFIPKARYLDVEFLKLELERLFPKTWLMACREEELFDVGNFVEYVIGDQSILLVKEAKDAIKAYHNACRHRGTRLASGSGRVGEIRCPFHGWRYNLDGTIKLVLDRDEFVPRSDDDLGLVQVRAEAWGGFVFINMDPGAQPLLAYLAPIPAALDSFGLENMRYRWLKGSILPCNWKTAVDAFIEAYHVPGTHPQLLRSDKNNRNPASLKELERRTYSPTEAFDIHARAYNEFRSAAGNTGGRYDRHNNNDEQDERLRLAVRVQYMVRELRALDTERDARAAEELKSADIPVGMSATSYFLKLRKRYAEAEGLDWPDLATEQFLAAGNEWHVFPNTIILPNQGCILGYRSRPNGLDPDSCIFEVFCLEQIPVAGYGERWMEWNFEPEFHKDWRNADLGGVLTQDFENMENVTVGMHSRSFDGHRVNLKQEITVYNHHRVADQYLWD